LHSSPDPGKKNLTGSPHSSAISLALSSPDSFSQNSFLTGNVIKASNNPATYPDKRASKQKSDTNIPVSAEMKKTLQGVMSERLVSFADTEKKRGTRPGLLSRMLKSISSLSRKKSASGYRNKSAFFQEKLQPNESRFIQKAASAPDVSRPDFSDRSQFFLRKAKSDTAYFSFNHTFENSAEHEALKRLTGEFKQDNAVVFSDPERSRICMKLAKKIVSICMRAVAHESGNKNSRVLLYKDVMADYHNRAIDDCLKLWSMSSDIKFSYEKVCNELGAIARRTNLHLDPSGKAKVNTPSAMNMIASNVKLMSANMDLNNLEAAALEHMALNYFREQVNAMMRKDHHPGFFYGDLVSRIIEKYK